MNDAPNPSRNRKSYSRAQHRALSHDSAHADVVPPDNVPEHPLVHRGPPQWIDTQSNLTQLLEHLRAAGRFAYDSEFIGEMTYVPKLCLLQVATEERIALIDPLAGLDLQPFWLLLCDGSIEKIIHAGAQDIEPVFRHTGQPAANLFDIQLAAGFAGMAYPVSLSKLVYELIGVRLGKGLTFTHWDQRPLSNMQMRYAADDVRYLPALHQRLLKRIEDLGHADWAREECAVMCDPTLYQFDPDSQYLRVRGANSLPPQGLAVLRELTIWRDSAARAHDEPPRALLKDEILLDMARSPVKSVQRLDRVRGLPKPIEQAHGTEIVAATLRALALPAADHPVPRQTEESPTERFRADSLWAAAQCLCAGQGIDPALVTSRQEIGDLHRRLTSGADVTALRLFQGWRAQAAGNALRDLVQTSRPLTLTWPHNALRATW